MKSVFLESEVMNERIKIRKYGIRVNGKEVRTGLLSDRDYEEWRKFYQGLNPDARVEVIEWEEEM